MVMTLLTEPGSKVVVSDALFDDGSAGRSAPSGRGSAVTLAMARISPVAGRLTMAMPPFAPVAATRSASTRSASYCIARSRVSTRSLPGRAASTCWRPPAISPPLPSPPAAVPRRS